LLEKGRIGGGKWFVQIVRAAYWECTPITSDRTPYKAEAGRGRCAKGELCKALRNVIAKCRRA
jgi:hypothetical protein